MTKMINLLLLAALGTLTTLCGLPWLGSALLACAMLGLTLALLPGMNDEPEES